MSDHREHITLDLKTLRRIEGEIASAFRRCRGNPTGHEKRVLHMNLRDMSRFKRRIRVLMSMYDHDSVFCTKVYERQQFIQKGMDYVKINRGLGKSMIEMKQVEKIFNVQNMSLSVAELMTESNHESEESTHEIMNVSEEEDMDEMMSDLSEQWKEKKALSFETDSFVIPMTRVASTDKKTKTKTTTRTVSTNKKIPASSSSSTSSLSLSGVRKAATSPHPRRQRKTTEEKAKLLT